ncbi:MAG: primosomal protein N' [Phycisphaerae bacterium]|nr:primosomal protein N' [Phycisphaerae bacterium]
MARSKRQGDGELLWRDEGTRRAGPVAEVAPILRISKAYSFAIPEELADSLSVGQRVTVPLGRRGRPTPAFVTRIDHGPWDATLRPIHGLIDDASFLTPELIELGREISRHYLCPLGITLKAMTPEAVRQERGLRTVRYVRAAVTAEKIEAEGHRLTEARRAILLALGSAGEAISQDALLEAAGASVGVLREMARRGWVEIERRRELPEEDADAGGDSPGELIDEPEFELNEEQVEALRRMRETIGAGAFKVTLLLGVSGSGKTEVYIRAMRSVMESGRQAMLLVPEIALTTQLVARLSRRLPGVAVNHSGLSEGQRSRLWRRIAAGETNVVVGTRSAVFAPCPKLGLICVDEEQEPSFKNLQAPRFHVRDAAIMRAARLGIPVVLGSATPSLESYYLSERRSDWQRVYLRRRVMELPLPKVHVVDMRDEVAELRRDVVLSRALENLLRETLERGEQAIILLNRRGFATKVICERCGTRVTCPNCNMAMVVHAASGQCVCHYCRLRIPIPETCPNLGCGGAMVQRGRGTQRIEQLLSERFPQARIRRADSDTMTHRRHYEEAVRDFERHEVDVLVGTQMIAKGLDFPKVSLVGVIDADASAPGGDFRAGERLFQLITQVAGRAGRASTGGRVVVQTTSPELPALRFALTHDFEAFATSELEVRRKTLLPPFRRLARFVLAHEREQTARSEAAALGERVREAIAALKLERADVLGPNPCALSRLRGQYRYDLLARTLSAGQLRELLAALENTKALRTRAKSLVVDVDPVTMS